MTSPYPQQNKPTGASPTTQGNRPEGQGNRPETQQPGRQDASKSQAGNDAQQLGANQDNASRSLIGGFERTSGSDKTARGGSGGSQDVQRCLDAIEENCGKLRQALSASSSKDAGQSESADRSRTDNRTDNRSDGDAGKSQRDASSTTR